MTRAVSIIREPSSAHGDIWHGVSEARGCPPRDFPRRSYTECGVHLENPGLARTSPELTAELRLIGPILDIRIGSVADVTCPYCSIAYSSPSAPRAVGGSR